LFTPPKQHCNTATVPLLGKADALDHLVRKRSPHIAEKRVKPLNIGGQRDMRLATRATVKRGALDIRIPNLEFFEILLANG